MPESMPAKPPVYLNLWRIRLPLPGWISILQRLSGAVLFLMLPLAIYLFQLSLTDAGYERIVRSQGFVGGKLLLGAALWFYLQHLLAGIRFLLLDLQFGTSLLWARRSSALTLVTSFLLTLFIVLGWR
ncbi:MAG: succinate dehydrogenase, cytochrome b556 subunit [Burkholderiales bacterium]